MEERGRLLARLDVKLARRLLQVLSKMKEFSV